MVPEGWVVKRLNDITEKISDGLHATPEYVPSSEYFFINGNNLKDNRIVINENTKCVSEDEYLKHKKELSTNSILLSINGTIGNLAYYNNEKVILGKSAAYINLDDNVVKEYVYYKLNSQKVLSYFQSELTGTTIRNLSLRSIKNTKIEIPPKLEQKKIAQILSTWDKAIETVEALIENSKAQKKALMQQLLTGGRRLMSYKDEQWNPVVLGELGGTYGGLTGKSKKDFGAGKPFIPYMNIFSHSAIDISNFDLVDITEKEKQNEVHYGDIFFTTSSETPHEVGMASVLLDDVKGVYLNSFCFGFRLHNFDTLLPEFARYIFRGAQFRREITKLAQGATRYNLSKKALLKLVTFLPSLKEQREIAAILHEAEKDIENLSSALLVLKKEKKALMQQLLTGKRRVRVGADDG